MHFRKWLKSFAFGNINIECIEMQMYKCIDSHLIHIKKTSFDAFMTDTNQYWHKTFSQMTISHDSCEFLYIISVDECYAMFCHDFVSNTSTIDGVVVLFSMCSFGYCVTVFGHQFRSLCDHMWMNRIRMQLKWTYICELNPFVSVKVTISMSINGIGFSNIV